MKISIIGWYSKSNVGDQAFYHVFSNEFCDHQIEFVTPPGTCNNPDIVILGGGAVVSPFYLNILPDCPRYALGVDIAYESEIDLMKKYDFKHVFVRNATDLSHMRSKLGCPVEAIPDLAFLIQPTGADILGKYRRTLKKPIGVFVTDYVNPAIDRSVDQFGARAYDFIQKMARQLDSLIRADYEVFLIPCATGGYGDDRRIDLDIAAFMREEPTNVMDTISPQDMIDLIRQLEASVCMRFHAHIFSFIAQCPFVSIEFTRKVKLFLQENSIHDVTFGSFERNAFHFDPLREKIEAVVRRYPLPDWHQRTASYHRQLASVMKRFRQDLLG